MHYCCGGSSRSHPISLAPPHAHPRRPQDAKGKKKGAAGKPKAGKSLMMERDGDFGDFADDDYKTSSAPAAAAAPAAVAAAAPAAAADEKSWRVVEDFM